MLAPMNVKMGMMLWRTFSCNQRVRWLPLHFNVCVWVFHDCTYREDTRQSTEQKQCMMVSLGHVWHPDALHYQLHVTFILLQHIYKHTQMQHVQTKLPYSTLKWNSRVWLHNRFNIFIGISCQVSGTFADRSSIRRQFLTDIQQTAEDELFCVLYILLFSCCRLQTSVAHNKTVFTIFYMTYVIEYSIRKFSEM